MHIYCNAELDAQQTIRAHALSRRNAGPEFTHLEPLHATGTLTRTAGSNALQTHLTRSLLQMQRSRGNRFVQRALAISKETMAGVRERPQVQRHAFNLSAVSESRPLQRDDDDTAKPPPLVGQDRAIDPNDKMCSLTFTFGGEKKWLTPSGVACDPPFKAHGDPFKYPSDQPDTPAAPSPTICPDGQPATPTGSCCPPGQQWNGSQCSQEPSLNVQQCLPGEQPTMFGTCCKPGQMMDTFGNMCPGWQPAPAPQQPQPGDYELPDQSNGVLA